MTGIPHKCPKCAEEDCLDLPAADVSNYVCRECTEDVTREDLEEIAATAQKLVKLLDRAQALIDSFAESEDDASEDDVPF